MDLNLPPARESEGTQVTIKLINESSDKKVTLLPSPNEKIDGKENLTLQSHLDSLLLISDGVQWVTFRGPTPNSIVVLNQEQTMATSSATYIARKEGSQFTLNLPNSAAHLGRKISVKIAAPSTSVTIFPKKGESLEGGENLLLSELNETVTLVSDGADWFISKHLNAPSSLAPVGEVIVFAGNKAPNGYLFADGREVSRQTYARLFNVIGTTFGEGNGSTTFNLPDLRGQFIRGLDNMGTESGAKGIDPGRLMGSLQEDATAINGLSLAEDSHNHSAATSSSGGHTHGYTDNGHTHGIGSASTGTAGGSAFTTANWDGVGGGIRPSQRSFTGLVIRQGGIHSHGVTLQQDSHSHELNGDTETRPKNVALKLAIKF